jgi:hypothetical protein
VWITGYSTVTLHLSSKGQTTRIILQDVAICPDLLCNLVSFRLLRQSGIWWDTQQMPTTLRKPDGSIIAEIAEIHGQWVLEYNPAAHAAHAAHAVHAVHAVHAAQAKPAAHAHADAAQATFYTRTSSRTLRAKQRASAVTWHKRLSHPGPAALEHLVQQAEGVRIKGITTVECNSCGRAKSKR